jgi:hypothetical protein
MGAREVKSALMHTANPSQGPALQPYMGKGRISRGVGQAAFLLSTKYCKSYCLGSHVTCFIGRLTEPQTEPHDRCSRGQILYFSFQTERLLNIPFNLPLSARASGAYPLCQISVSGMSLLSVLPIPDALRLADVDSNPAGKAR